MKGIADYVFDGTPAPGNHGTFHRAEAPARLGHDGPVMVKVLDERATEAGLRRMANELRCLATAGSPYLVEILDAGSQDGWLFYACPHHPLGTLAEPARPIDRDHALAAVADAADGAHALHEVGVAHRDIKPANVWLTDGGGRLADLGLAQLLNPGRTATGIGPVGALEYLSPELARGDEAGRASDCWAMGATLHRALVGRSIHPGLPTDSLLAALRYLLDSPPVVADEVTGGERELLTACLAPSPADRPSTAAELAAAIRRLIR